MDNVESRTSTREAMLIERTKNLIEKEWISKVFLRLSGPPWQEYSPAWMTNEWLIWN